MVSGPTAPWPSPLVRALDDVPHFATVAAITLSPRALLSRAGQEARLIEQVLPRTIERARARLAEAGDGLGRHLNGAAKLAAAGVDLDQPAWMFQGDPMGPVVLSFGLTDRPRFEAHLRHKDHAPHRVLELRGERALVILADSDLPLACLVRSSRAYCQLGLTNEKAPLELLTAATVRRPRPLTRQRHLQPILQDLPSKGLAYVIFSRDAVTHRATAAIAERAQRAGRLESAPARHARRDQARRAARLVEETMAHVQLAAATLMTTGDGLRAELHVTLDDKGARQMRRWFDLPRRAGRLEQWASTPALARILFRGHPRLITNTLHAVGVTLPPSTLGGTVAILALGLDAESAAARGDAALTPMSLLEVIPTAIGAHLTTPLDARGPSGRGPALPSDPSPVLRKRIDGVGVEVRARDDVVLLGVGAGSGAAAERRWRRTQPDRTSEAKAPFIELGVDLAAVSAAFKANVMPSDARRELRLLDRLQHKLTPLLHRYRAVDVRCWSRSRHRKLKVQVDVGGVGD